MQDPLIRTLLGDISAKEKVATDAASSDARRSNHKLRLECRNELERVEDKKVHLKRLKLLPRIFSVP
jgi:hypothetical protein